MDSKFSHKFIFYYRTSTLVISNTYYKFPCNVVTLKFVFLSEVFTVSLVALQVLQLYV